MKPTLRIAVLRAPGHGGRTLLRTLGGRVEDRRVHVTTVTRDYELTLGMPEAGADELPVHGAILVVRGEVAEGTHRALKHAQARRVERIVLVINGKDDDLERSAREAMYAHGFDGDEAIAVQGFDRGNVLALLEELPYFELGQELVPALMNVLRVLEDGEQPFDVLRRDVPVARRPLARLFAVLVDGKFVSLDRDGIVRLEAQGRDALEEPALLAAASGLAWRAPRRTRRVRENDPWEHRAVHLRRAKDNASAIDLGPHARLDEAIDATLRWLPSTMRTQDALVALQGALDVGQQTWLELPHVDDVRAALSELASLRRLFGRRDDEWRVLGRMHDWLAMDARRVVFQVTTREAW